MKILPGLKRDPTSRSILPTASMHSSRGVRVSDLSCHGAALVAADSHPIAVSLTRRMDRRCERSRARACHVF
jgi:hypothetical protein